MDDPAGRDLPARPFLFLIVDAIPLEVAREAWQAGELPGFAPPRPMVSVFPSLTNVAVGALLQGFNSDSAGTYCSGTLIGCETFLTAAHCVDGFGPDDMWVFVPSAGLLPVSSIAIHPDYDFPIADVAVLKLATPVNGVAPSRINTVGPPPFTHCDTPGIWMRGLTRITPTTRSAIVPSLM